MSDALKVLASALDFAAGLDDPNARRMLSYVPSPPFTPRALAPRLYPVTEFVPAARAGAAPAATVLIDALIAAAPKLHWWQSYVATDFSDTFLTRYGFVELLGTRGQFVCDGVAIGITMLGSNIEYPAHHHVAEELYIPISGTADWMRDNGPYTLRLPGAVIHHPSQMHHAMRTNTEPLLALYIWRGGDLAQKSDIPARVND
ncbi:MAG TPA: dimethylsulfonioproprionate lyase family protein [Thermohalobaculum sp.]|nr:dimethylsulfonioproprionate lyase family protein [Thermohalobaculum sp.]